MYYKCVSLQAFYLNTDYPIQWGGGKKACIRSSADCNTSTLVWPWHQLMWFGGMQACNSNNYPSHSCRHGKTWLSIRSSLELETKSYQKLYNMSGFLFSCSVIYCNVLAWFWHGLASKTLHPKAFSKAFSSRITSQTWIMRGSLSLCITRLYLVIDRRRHVWTFHAEKVPTLRLNWNVPWRSALKLECCMIWLII